MTQLFQLQRIKTKEVIFVGGCNECLYIRQKANALTISPTLEMQPASLESIKKKDELGNKRIFLLQEEKADKTLPNPFFEKTSLDRLTDDYDAGNCCAWPPDYNSEGGSFNPIDEHFGETSESNKDCKTRVQEYLGKLNLRKIRKKSNSSKIKV